MYIKYIKTTQWNFYKLTTLQESGRKMGNKHDQILLRQYKPC